MPTNQYCTVMFQPLRASLMLGQQSVPHSSMLWMASKFTWEESCRTEDE